jgi:hypothetical protein
MGSTMNRDNLPDDAIIKEEESWKLSDGGIVSRVADHFLIHLRVSTPYLPTYSSIPPLRILQILDQQYHQIVQYIPI